MPRCAYAEVTPAHIPSTHTINGNSVRSTFQEAIRASLTGVPANIRRVTLHETPRDGSVPVWAARSAKGKPVMSSIRATVKDVQAAYACVSPIPFYLTLGNEKRNDNRDLAPSAKLAPKAVAKRLLSHADDEQALKKYAKRIGTSYPTIIDQVLNLIPHDIRIQCEETIRTTAAKDKQRNSRTKDPRAQELRGQETAEIVLSKTKNPANKLPAEPDRSLSYEEARRFIQATPDEFSRWTSSAGKIRIAPSFLSPSFQESGIIYNRRRYMPEDLLTILPEIPDWRKADAEPDQSVPGFPRPKKQKRNTKFRSKNHVQIQSS